MNLRQELHEVIDKLDESQITRLMPIARSVQSGSAVRNDLAERELFELLKSLPNVTVPAQWPPRFRDVVPIQIDGEPVSEILIRERR
jgi:hypothetical protein